MMNIDWNKPVRTTCGKPVRVVYRNRKALDGRNKLLLIDRGDHESVDVADDQGRGDFYKYKNVPEKREGWINVYSDRRRCCIYPSKEEADGWAIEGRIACVRVEYEIPAVEANQ